MIHPFFATNTVTIHPATVTTQFGKTTRKWGVEPDRIVEGCHIKSGPAQEVLTREEAAVTEYTISMPPGVQITRHDRVSFVYGGQQYGGTPATGLELTAPPRRPSGPTGLLDRTIVATRSREES